MDLADARLDERRAREVLVGQRPGRLVAELPLPPVAGSEAVAVLPKRSAIWAWLSAHFAPDPIGSERA
jgi:hypothetical protein